MIISATGKSFRAGGFSLVELLTVVAIMAIIMGVVVVSVQGMQRPGLQTAASQVSSGLSLARQLAITRNTTAAFIIATNTGTGMPAEPFRSWAVIFSNRGFSNWTLFKDWERLPEGAVFAQLLGSQFVSGFAYNSLTNNAWTNSVGSPFVPSKFLTNMAAATFSSLATVKAGASTFNFQSCPQIRFGSSGDVAGNAFAIRLADGVVNSSGQVILRSTNRYYFVESDQTTGRIRVRAPESYQP